METCKEHSKLCDMHREFEIETAKINNKICSRLDGHGNGIREIGKQVMEIKDALIGTLQSPGLVPKTKKSPAAIIDSSDPR